MKNDKEHMPDDIEYSGKRRPRMSRKKYLAKAGEKVRDTAGYVYAQTQSEEEKQAGKEKKTVAKAGKRITDLKPSHTRQSRLKEKKTVIADDTDYDGRKSESDLEYSGRKRQNKRGLNKSGTGKVIRKNVKILTRIGVFIKLSIAAGLKILILPIVMGILIIVTCVLPVVSSSVGTGTASSTDAGEWIWPVSGCYYVTSAYGLRELEGAANHHGMDIGCPEGTEIYAVAIGVVETASYNSSLGYYIVINHGGVRSIYGHNSRILVASGDYVITGDLIALSGNTGYSTGPHCHFGVQSSDGSYHNPALYFGLPEDFIGDASEYVK